MYTAENPARQKARIGLCRHLLECVRSRAIEWPKHSKFRRVCMSAMVPCRRGGECACRKLGINQRGALPRYWRQAVQNMAPLSLRIRQRREIEACSSLPGSEASTNGSAMAALEISCARVAARRKCVRVLLARRLRNKHALRLGVKALSSAVHFSYSGDSFICECLAMWQCHRLIKYFENGASIEPPAAPPRARWAASSFQSLIQIKTAHRRLLRAPCYNA